MSEEKKLKLPSSLEIFRHERFSFKPATYVKKKKIQNFYVVLQIIIIECTPFGKSNWPLLNEI